MKWKAYFMTACVTQRQIWLNSSFQWKAISSVVSSVRDPSSESESCSVVPDSLRPHGLYSPWNSPGQHTGVGSLSLLQGSSQARDQTRSPALQVDLLPTEPQEKPKKTGVGSISLLQGIFQTQELNWGLLPCRWILYQLSSYLKHFRSKEEK